MKLGKKNKTPDSLELQSHETETSGRHELTKQFAFIAEEPEKKFEDDEDVELDDVAISDHDMAAEDEQSRQAEKNAAKTAKLRRTPEEKKKLRRKQLWIGLGFGFLVLALLIGVPLSRHWISNAIGLRHTVLVVIKEKESKNTLTGATVFLNGVLTGTTDAEGRVTIQDAHIGPLRVLAEKPGYSHEEVHIINELWDTKSTAIELKTIGMRLDVDLKHWLSGDPIPNATVQYRDTIKTQSDKNGRASIVIPPTDQKKIDLHISAEGYLPRTVSTATEVSAREVVLTSAVKDYFISKRDGKLDIFSTNLDGTDQKKIIEATGKEDERLLQWTISRDNKQAILVASREGKRINNRVVAGVYVVDLPGATLRKIDEGSDVQVLGWAQDTIVYTKTAPELNYDDAAFTRLTAYTVTNNKLAQLTQSNYFGGLAVSQSKVYFMPEDAYRPIENPAYTSIDIGTGARQQFLTGQRISYAISENYDTIRVTTHENKQFRIKVRTGATSQADSANPSNLEVALSPKGDQIMWADRRDGQGALLVRAAAGGDEKTVVRYGGMIAPVRFIADDMAVVRVATTQETADYVVHLGSGKMVKIVDVSASSLLRSSQP